MTYYPALALLRRLAVGGAGGRPRAPATPCGLPPAGLYPCKPFGANDYIYLQPLTEGHWDALCRAMDRPDLRADPRFYSQRWRLQNADALREEIGAWFRERTKYEAMETIAGAGVPCSACLDTVDLHRDRHLAARGFLHELDLPVHGRVRMLGFAPGPSASCAADDAPAPAGRAYPRGAERGAGPERRGDRGAARRGRHSGRRSPVGERRAFAHS